MGGLCQRRQRAAQCGAVASPRHASPQRRPSRSARAATTSRHELGPTRLQIPASRRSRGAARRARRSGTRRAAAARAAPTSSWRPGLWPISSTLVDAPAPRPAVARADRRPTRGRARLRSRRAGDPSAGATRSSVARARTAVEQSTRSGRTSWSAAHCPHRACAALRPRGASGRSWSASAGIVPARLQRAGGARGASPALPPAADERGLAGRLRRRARPRDLAAQLGDRARWRHRRRARGGRAGSRPPFPFARRRPSSARRRSLRPRARRRCRRGSGSRGRAWALPMSGIGWAILRVPSSQRS